MKSQHTKRQRSEGSAVSKKRRTSTAHTSARKGSQPSLSTTSGKSAATGDEDSEVTTPKSLLTHDLDGLTYILDRMPKKNGRRSIVTVRITGSENSKTLRDRVDLFSFGSCQRFSGFVADNFGRKVDDVIGHLALIADEIERAETKRSVSVRPVLTPARVKAAEKLLASKNLLDRAAQAFDVLGYVGEHRTKKLAYLVATSRLLPRPLSAILMAPSGAGKSELLDKLALLIPEESIEFLSRLTPASLYYLGEDYLRHRLVLVDEHVGTTEADYPIRSLQSKGLLRLAATVKGKTEPFTVRGPIALMSGTTDCNLNPENLSRCLELSLDDSREQTKLIQEAQRRAWAGDETEGNIDVWRDAQRLLEPLQVVIPFATKLDYPTRTTKDRRDNQKLLTLVAAHALLHQRQREKDKDSRLVATVADYRVVYDLVKTNVEEEVEGLSPRAATLYRSLLERGEDPFSRREVAEAIGWSYMTTTRALEELVANELAAVTDREYVRSYVVLQSSIFGNGSSLKRPNEIK
jgi:DNA primase